VKSYEHLFLEALQNHEMNWNMSEMVQSIHFTDDFVVVPKSQSPNVEACEVTHPFLASRIFAKQFGITQHLVDHIASRPVTFNVILFVKRKSIVIFMSFNKKIVFDCVPTMLVIS
jgi:cobalamin biosynthesis protein CobT